MQEMQENQVQSLGWEDPGVGNGNPLQYSCLENSMDRGAWWAPWGHRELDITEQIHLPQSIWLPLLHEHFKEVWEKNSVEVARDLFRRTRDIKGTFHARMGMIKDRNSKNIQNYIRTVLMTQITTMMWSLTWSSTSGVWGQGGFRKHHYDQS